MNVRRNTHSVLAWRFLTGEPASPLQGVSSPVPPQPQMHKPGAQPRTGLGTCCTSRRSPLFYQRGSRGMWPVQGHTGQGEQHNPLLPERVRVPRPQESSREAGPPGQPDAALGPCGRPRKVLAEAFSWVSRGNRLGRFGIKSLAQRSSPVGRTKCP